MNDNRFELVGRRPAEKKPAQPSKKRHAKKPAGSAILLALILAGCFFGSLFLTQDPFYMDLAGYHAAPGPSHFFGTDSMGRDIFSMIWHGGRVSLLIGFASAALSTLIAIVFGTASGLAPRWLDRLMMRFAEIVLSVPSLLFVVLFQAILGEATVPGIAFVIGITGWMDIAKVVRTEVLRLRESDHILAAKCMGAGFFHILWKHLTPNFISSIMFMSVMKIRSAMIAESTLSFMGIGLPLEIISWGSMLSLSEKALLSGAWWTILIPGAFLVVTLVSITNLGNCLRQNASRKHSNL